MIEYALLLAFLSIAALFGIASVGRSAQRPLAIAALAAKGSVTVVTPMMNNTAGGSDGGSTPPVYATAGGGTEGTSYTIECPPTERVCQLFHAEAIED